VRLGELLKSEKLVTSAQIEEALEAQVVHGGRLGTNLVELGFLKEIDLAKALGRLNNLPYASGEMLAEPTALSTVPAQYCDDHDVFPMRVESTRLTLVVMGYSQMKTIDELGFKLGKKIVPVVVPEFRMNQLLRKYCKAFRPLRPIDMNTLRPSAKVANQGPQPMAAADLINEDDFAKLYEQAVIAHEEPEVTGELLEDVPLTAPRPPALSAILSAAPSPALPMPPTATPVTAAPMASVSAAAVPAPMLSTPSGIKNVPEPSPIKSFAEAQGLLQKSTNREEIAQTVCRFARSKFKRVLILNVQGDLVTGWHGMGQGVNQKLVRRIGVSLREANTLKLVRDLKSHFVGPMKRTPGMAVFYKLLGGGYPTTAVLMPLLVRSKLVHLLYVDQGPDELTPPDVGELLIVSQSVTRSYEALIQQRKSQKAAVP
jgi:hypothetical protein